MAKELEAAAKEGVEVADRVLNAYYNAFIPILVGLNWKVLHHVLDQRTASNR